MESNHPYAFFVVQDPIRKGYVLMTPSVYAETESKFFPAHWDEQTRALVKFMIQEAYQAGKNDGYVAFKMTNKS
jgi:hypothetical protein